jgi:hypothetical protein
MLRNVSVRRGLDMMHFWSVRARYRVPVAATTEKRALGRKDFEVACIDVGAVKINADLAIEKVVEIILKLRKIKKTY